MEEEKTDKLQAVKEKEEIILGGKNLKLELDRLGNEEFTNLNAVRMNEKYWGSLRSLDVAAQNDFEDAQSHRKKVMEIVNHPKVREKKWADDPWYNVYLEFMIIIQKITNIISYKDWQIEFLKKLNNKNLDVLQTIQEASGEDIRFKTMSTNLEGVFKKYDTIFDKMITSNQENIKTILTNRNSQGDDGIQNTLNKIMNRLENLETILGKGPPRKNGSQDEESSQETVPPEKSPRILLLTHGRRTVMLHLIKHPGATFAEILGAGIIDGANGKKALAYLQKIKFIDEKNYPIGKWNSSN